MAILTALHNLRFTDNAMSATQGLGWGALQAQFAAGKLGMYIAAPDDVYNEIMTTDKGNINDIGMGPLPSVTGTAAGSLSGGDDYMFAKNDTPAQIEAGIKFINFEDLTPGDGPVQLRQAEGGRAAGRLRRACCSTGAVGRRSTSSGARPRRSTSPTTSRTSTRTRRATASRPTRRRFTRRWTRRCWRYSPSERQYPGAAQGGSDQRQHVLQFVAG